jgi:methylmalonyl-CoA mutase N-terminal domain/subunit
MYVAVAEKEGVPAERISGTTQNDILKEFIARGTQVFPPRDSLRLTVDVIEYCTANLPRWNAINICGYHVREAGSTLVQEVAFALANAITYIEACLERGMDVDAFAPRLAFNFSASANIFQEAAKFRATRRMWARLLKDRFGAKQAASLMFRTGAGSAGSTLTAQQPENNIVRVALQALSGILGGVQSFHSASFDEALAIPTEHSALVALRTQQVLAHESGAAEVIDPLGGSYYVEALTDRIEAEVNLYIAQIEADGGMLKAIEDGRAQAQIAEASFAQQPKIELHRPNPDIVAAQIAKLQQLRRERDNGAVEAALARLKDEAQGNGNLMYPILEAVRAYATIGEICGVEREVFGEYQAAAI